MQQPAALGRWLAGAAGFAFVVTWATAGATTAVVAVVVGFAAMHHAEARAFLARRRTARRRSPRRETARDYQLVPDDPSLILSVQT